MLHLHIFTIYGTVHVVIILFSYSIMAASDENTVLHLSNKEKV